MDESIPGDDGLASPHHQEIDNSRPRTRCNGQSRSNIKRGSRKA